MFRIYHGDANSHANVTLSCASLTMFLYCIASSTSVSSSIYFEDKTAVYNFYHDINSARAVTLRIIF